MGISRRKAGTVVQCPRCAGQVIVPDPDPHEAPVDQEAPVEPKKPRKSPNDLFERSDIDQLLQQEPIAYNPPQQTVRAGDGACLPKHAAPPPMQPAPDEPAGVVLTPVRMTVLAVSIVLLLGLAFFLGLVVGGNP